MHIDVDALFDQFVYNIRGKLESALYAAAEEGSPESIAEAEKILSFLYGASSFTDDERCQRAAEIFRDANLSPKERKAAMQRALKASGGRSGRPKEKGQDAINAFTIHLRTDRSWREITLEIQGSCESRKCEYFCPECGDVKRKRDKGRLDRHPGHRKPCPKCKCLVRTKKERVCKWCWDAMRDLVGQLEELLKEIGAYPSLPRRKDLKAMSATELERLLSQ
jgi:hypothetical protein